MYEDLKSGKKTYYAYALKKKKEEWKLTNLIYDVNNTI